MPFNPNDFWGIQERGRPISNSERSRAKMYCHLNNRQLENDITVWRALHYTKPKDAGMGENPFTRDRWNLSKRKLGIVAGVNMNTDHETVEREFSGTLAGLKKAEDYSINKILSGEDESYHILCMGFEDGRRLDNFMESINRKGNSWW